MAFALLGFSCCAPSDRRLAPTLMRLVHYYPDALSDSGVSAALWGWARALADAGGDVVVLGSEAAVRHTPESFVTARDGRVPTHVVRHLGRNRITRVPIDLGRHLVQGDILVLHEGWVPSNAVAAALASRAGVPYLVVPHGVYTPLWVKYLRPPVRLRTRIERRVLEGAAAVHVFFEGEIDLVRRIAPDSSFIVAPTGMDVPERRWRGGGGYLTWIGRYDPYHKGLDLLVDALASMDPLVRPSVRLHGYDYKGGLARLREHLARFPELAEEITVGGPISGTAKLELLLDSDGYVLPSRWESHSVALLEVLALGIPSVVSDVLPIASRLQAHGAAVLTEPAAEPLASALATFAARPESTAARAREMVQKEFAWDRVIADFLAQLRQLGITS